MGIRDDILDVGDTLVRLPFWLLIEAILSHRYYPILRPVSLLFEWAASVSTFRWNHTPIQLLICVVFCASLLSALLQPRGLLVFTLLTLTGLSVCVNTVVYTALLHHVPKLEWQGYAFPDQLIRAFWTGSGATLLLVLVAQHLLAYPNGVAWRRRAITVLLFCSLPLIALLAIVFFAVLLSGSLPHGTFTFLLSTRIDARLPVWFTYYLLWVEPRRDLFPVCIADDEPNLFWIYCLAAAWFFCSNLCAVQWCTPYSRIGELISSCVEEQADQFQTLGVYSFLSAHWNRLNMSRVLAFLWSFKVILVVTLGPSMWSILSPGAGKPTGGLVDRQLANISFLQNYVLSSHNQSTLSVLLTRLYVGTLVHGSETWLMVFGAAAFFGGLGIVLVHTLTLFLDPLGENLNRIRLVAADAPADVRGWNAIDDPELAMHQNEVQTADMLSNVGWNCAILFLFLAFQYDLPSLQLNERIYCSVYGIIVMLITCVHPIQGLIKSLLLQLGVPGRDVPWFSHVRPLCTCILLISTCILLLANVPISMTEPEVNDGSQAVGNAENQPVTSYAAGLYNVRFHSSFESMRIRRFRLFLCAGQLVVSLLANLIEYGIYQRQLRQPDWTGFRISFFWTKLVTHVVDYLLSLLSFLTVCWLTVYDSVGVCRVLIICCYFHFILYPSTHRAYTWIRWKLYAERSLRQLAHPTDDQLSRLADNCAICYSEMASDASVVTRCGHIYHTDCLSRWMVRQPSCPMCHSDLLSTEVKDLRNLPVAGQAPPPPAQPGDVRPGE